MPPMFSEVSVSALSHPHTIACPYKYIQILELLRLSYKARAYLPSLGNLIILGKKILHIILAMKDSILSSIYLISLVG